MGFEGWGMGFEGWGFERWGLRGGLGRVDVEGGGCGRKSGVLWGGILGGGVRMRRGFSWEFLLYRRVHWRQCVRWRRCGGREWL